MTANHKKAITIITAMQPSYLKQIFYMASKEAKVMLKPGTDLEAQLWEVLNLLKKDGE